MHVYESQPVLTWMCASLQGANSTLVHTVVEESFEVGENGSAPVVVLGVVIRGEPNNVPRKGFGMLVHEPPVASKVKKQKN